jgi:lipopolysaccharide/colanic/teichoic acid biosynthesis glycosyltransferase
LDLAAEGVSTVKTINNGEQHESHSMNGRAQVSTYFDRKARATRVFGALLLVIASPLIAFLVALVRCTSGGPGLYRQTRIGKHGREFEMYKIRTMYVNAESVSGPVWSTTGDSRITPIGKVLRLLHLDELPQLINIVRGEMDLIGPRPERPSFVNWLAQEIPNYCDRLRVLPGVTGLAQINLPPDKTIDCVRKKLAIDRHYLNVANLGLDLRILACTFLRMIGVRHGRAARWLGVMYEVGSQMNVDGDSSSALADWQRVTKVRSVADSLSSDENDELAYIAVGDEGGDRGS